MVAVQAQDDWVSQRQQDLRERVVLVAARVIEVALEEAADLQHSKKFVKKESSSIMRQTPMLKGDSNISRGFAHGAKTLTESEGFGEAEKLSQNPANTASKWCWRPVFTPDTGMGDAIEASERKIASAQATF